MINIPSDQINQARVILNEAKDILIAVAKNVNKDRLASALSLYLALSAKGKRVNTICPTQMTVEFNHLIGIDKVGNRINGNWGKNLVISFPYQEGSIEKVSYNIENDLFNLVIEPREGYPQITPEMMRYSYSGGNIDLIITIGATQFTDLDYLYKENQSIFNEKQIINIDNQYQNQRFGKVNLVEPNASSISEMIILLLSSFGLNLDSDIATNILEGIACGSQNFTSPQTDASTFEAAAICLKNGAKKITVSDTKETPFPAQMPQFTPPYQTQPQYKQTQKMKYIPKFQTRPFQPQANRQLYTTPFTQTDEQAYKIQTTPMEQSQKSSPFTQTDEQAYKIQTPQIKPNEKSLQTENTTSPFQTQSAKQPAQKQPQNENPPPDWLKPKIYKGSTLL